MAHGFHFTTVAGVVVVAALALAGCSGQPAGEQGAAGGHEGEDHAHEHVSEADVRLPADLPAAVVRLKELHAKVRAAIEGKDSHAAHAPLDELYIVTGKLTSIARDTGVSKDHWKDINLIAKELEGHLEKLHDDLDKDVTAGYAELAPKIDEAIARFETLIVKLDDPTPAGEASAEPESN